MRGMDAQLEAELPKGMHAISTSTKHFAVIGTGVGNSKGLVLGFRVG